MAMNEQQDVVIEGRVMRIRFETDDGEFQVFVVRDAKGGHRTATARSAGLRQGEEVKLTGQWKEHKSGERQLAASIVERNLPTTEEGLVSYLSSDQIPGIGPSLAKQIVEKFGTDTLRVLDDDPDRLREVPGIGKKRLDTIREAWGESTAVRSVMLFLQSHGISPAFANRIYRTYGAKAVAIVQDNPYRLARDVRGIGFRMADAIARKSGIGRADPRRIAAGIFYLLYAAASEGHSFLPEEEVVSRGTELLQISFEQVAARLAVLVESNELVHEMGGDGVAAIYHTETFISETAVARQVDALAHSTRRMPTMDAAALAALESKWGFALHQSQREALLTVMDASFSVLTGGPGTGKTTIIRAIVEFAAKAERPVALAAPTGRAAKRLSEATDSEAKTVHRLLRYDPRAGEFQLGEDDPIDADLVIVDEASMLDLKLAQSLFAAVRDGCSVILVGDAEQLPSVGAGDVLADLINAEHVTVARLSRVFRQAEGSEIVSCAHAMREGEMPEPSTSPTGEFFFVNADTPAKASAITVHLVTERIPKAFGLSPSADIQVLVPTHRGPLGTVAINEAIQKALALPGPAIERGAITFRVGDKVMQTRNNYDFEVYNGDIGSVTALSVDDAALTVTYEGREVSYKRQDLDQIQLAYAVSVHKSQGSEFKAVVLVLSTQHYRMLQRNLVYTAVTPSARAFDHRRDAPRSTHGARQRERRRSLTRGSTRESSDASRTRWSDVS